MKYLKIVAFVILYLAIVTVFQLGVHKLWFSGILPESIMYSEYNFTVLIGFSLPVLVFYFIFKFRKINMLKACNVNKLSIPNVGISVVLGILMGIFTACVCNTEYIVNEVPLFNEFLHNQTNGNSNIILFMVVIGIAFSMEELVFRGVLVYEIQTGFSPYATVILSTLVYGVLNIITIQFEVGVYAVMAAIFFALANLFMRSIFASMILQVCSIYVIYILIKTGLWMDLRTLGNTTLVLIILAVIASIVGIYGYLYTRFKKAVPTKSLSF